MKLDDLPPVEVMWEGKYIRVVRRGGELFAAYKSARVGGAVNPRDAATPGSSGIRTVIAAYCSYGTLSATDSTCPSREEAR